MYKVEISPKTILFSVGLIVLIYFIWTIKDLIFSLFIAFIIMSALKPSIIWLEKKKIPRTLSVVTVYLSFVLVFAFLFSLILPPIVFETHNLFINLPMLVKNINPSIYSWFNVGSISQYIPTVTSRFFQIASSVFSNAIFVISTLFFGFYLLLQENILQHIVKNFLEDHQVCKVEKALEKAEKQMHAWFWGELSLMTVVGIMTFVGLNVIGMKYALALAVLAGLMEVIPNLGPILSAAPAVLIGFSISPLLGAVVIAMYLIVQQLENNLIVPVIMKNAVGLNPIITLIALVVGGRVGGIIGVFLAIPAYLFIEVMVIELILNKKSYGESADKMRE